MEEEEINQIKKEHFIMRRAIERIHLMHSRAILNGDPLQEKVLWVNVNYVMKHTKSRSTSELGIPPLRTEKENWVIFKVFKKEEDG